MAKQTKPVAKKTTTTKKPIAKKAPAKKPVTRKPAPRTTAKKTSTGIATRRPDANLPPTANMVNSLTDGGAWVTGTRIA